MAFLRTVVLFCSHNALLRGVSAAWLAGSICLTATAAEPPTREQALATMTRATRFMVEKVSTQGGYVWAYLPDFSRRWGELEARESMIWIQPPGTPSMGHLFLDAYHATHDEAYYEAAEQVGGALIRGQHPSGGWNYVVDFAGEQSLREWYATVGGNAWRLEEFQHYYGNATFDDAGTAQAAKFLLRLYLAKRDPRHRPALERAISFFTQSQHPVGAWPQRYPLMNEFSHGGRPDYTSFLTFNDDVAAENIDFLILCYHGLGETGLREPLERAMNAFLVTQQAAPQPGWALQYTPDLRPAGARSYEPRALATHTTAQCVGQLLKFYQWTGEARFLARIPEALDWLDAARLPEEMRIEGATHPTFLEIGTNRPLFIHRAGSNVMNGHYYVDYDAHNTVAHYSSTRHLDVPALRARFEHLRALPVAEATKGSPLLPCGEAGEFPKFFTRMIEERGHTPTRADRRKRAAKAIATLNSEGYWPAELRMTSHPYQRDGGAAVVSGDFARTQTGDESDTSPFRSTQPTPAITTFAYIRNMHALIEFVSDDGR